MPRRWSPSVGLAALPLVLLLAGCGAKIPGGRALAPLLGAGDCKPQPQCLEQPAEVKVQVRGKVVLEDALATQPVAFARLNVRRGSTVVTTTSTDRAGSFQLFGLDHGGYQVVLESDRYEAQGFVEVGFRTTEVVLSARTRSQTP
jgi:hypothetical protein